MDGELPTCRAIRVWRPSCCPRGPQSANEWQSSQQHMEDVKREALPSTSLRLGCTPCMPCTRASAVCWDTRGLARLALVLAISAPLGSRIAQPPTVLSCCRMPEAFEGSRAGA